MAQKIINNDRNASLTIVDILSLLIFSDDRANLKFKSKTMAKTDFKVFKNIGIFLYIYIYICSTNFAKSLLSGFWRVYKFVNFSSSI